MGWIILLALIVIITVAPFYLDSRRKTINDRARAGSGMKFADLSQGVTAYRWVGPTRGPVAVMIHGLTTPSIAFADLAEGVGQLGYRVLVYDLYGRGLSDAPSGKQDSAFFVTQLDDLLRDQHITDDVTLFGYSMGGSIATVFAAQKPHRIKRVILLATAGVLTQESAFSSFCRRVPLLGDWIHHSIGAERMKRALRDTPEAEGAVLAAQKAELDRSGFLPAVLASRRGMLNDQLEAEHRLLGREDVPVVAIWGGQDQVIPLAAMGRLAQWNRSARQDEERSAAHGLPFTHSAEILTILRSAFRDD
ncbi:alpha/beta fold hydrolase [Yoonia sp. 208BN28-4]|uniref:alpha/beta fold hydrolase n=1 Tax=Yoonia sp. 208BN28-4 TaxID=3126505 RepID=UPI0030A89ACC